MRPAKSRPSLSHAAYHAREADNRHRNPCNLLLRKTECAISTARAGTWCHSPNVYIWKDRFWDRLEHLSSSSVTLFGMHALSLALLALPLAGATAPAPRPRLTVHESREAAPKGFVKVGPAPPKETLTLRLGLVQNDASGLEERLMDVSTPSSANYGKFLSKEEVLSSTGILEQRLRPSRSKLWLHPSKKQSTPSTRSSRRTGFPPRLTHQLVTSFRLRSPLNRRTLSSRRSSIISGMWTQTRKSFVLSNTPSRLPSQGTWTSSTQRPCA